MLSPETENLLLTIGLTGLMGFMGFIIYDLAKQSKAGKFGTMILFFVLGLGVLGFIIKIVITYIMDV